MPTKNASKILIMFWLPVFVCMGIIFYASSVPGKNIPSLFPFQDTAFHLLVYLLLAFCFARALKNTFSNIKYSQVILFTVIFGILYGLSDEFHQIFVPNRTPDLFDVFIDGIGTLTGSLIYR